MEGHDSNDVKAAEFRLARELSKTAARGVLGGLFYLLGWLVVGYFGRVYSRTAAIGYVVLALFLLLAFARVLLARWTADGRLAPRRLLVAWWFLFISTALLWGAVTLWVELDPAMQATRMAAVVCTVAYATAYAHALAMRWAGASIGIALIFLPSVALNWIVPGQPGVAIALTVYLVYLVSALRQSHAQYSRHITLELALSQQRDRFELQSRTDALTGLNNRREFVFALERGFASDRVLSLLMIDIDHFKRINDRHGHAAGDTVLIAFSEQLRQHFPQPDTVLARLGGEEFAVLLPGVDENHAAIMAQQLCARLAAAPLQPAAERGAVTVSIGAGQRQARRHGKSGDFLAEVDRLLYQAKAEGRNRVCRSGAAPG